MRLGVLWLLLLSCMSVCVAVCVHGEHVCIVRAHGDEVR